MWCFSAFSTAGLLVRKYSVALLFVSLFTHLSVDRGANATDSSLTVRELLQGLQDVEQIAKSFRVDFEYRRANDDAWGSPVLSFDATYLADDTGRIRLERSDTRLLTDDTGKQFEGRVEVIAAYNGTVLRQMEGRDKFTTGRISANVGEMPWGATPRNFLTHFFDKPVSQILRDSGAIIVGRANAEVLTVDTRENYVESDKTRRKYRFKVDKTFSVVEKAALVKAEGSDKWYVYMRIKSSDYGPTKSGVWVPKTGTYESIDVDDVMQGKEKSPKIRFRNEFTFSEWDLSPHWDDSTFELTFPPGVTVTDEVEGRTYIITGELSDDGITKYVLRENEKSAEYSASFNRRFWIITINVLALAICVTFIGWRKFKRSANG